MAPKTYQINPNGFPVSLWIKKNSLNQVRLFLKYYSRFYLIAGAFF